MAISCITNHKLFNQFVSNKKKIIPEITDDWELSQERGGMGHLDGVNLYSKKLDQNVFDISFSHYLKFIKEHDVVSRGGKIEGKFIIGSDRKLYSLEQWQKLQDNINRITYNIIPKKNWIKGNTYATECGSQVMYLGKQYLVRENKGKLNVQLHHLYIDREKYLIGNWIDTYRGVQHINGSMKFVEIVHEFDEDNFDKVDKCVHEGMICNRHFIGHHPTKIIHPELKIVNDPKFTKNLRIHTNGEDFAFNTREYYNRYFQVIDLESMTYELKSTFDGKEFNYNTRNNKGWFEQTGYIGNEDDYVPNTGTIFD